MSEKKVIVKKVIINLCEYCLNGTGGECHVPECALCRNCAPDIQIPPEVYTVVSEYEVD